MSDEKQSAIQSLASPGHAAAHQFLGQVAKAGLSRNGIDNDNPAVDVTVPGHLRLHLAWAAQTASLRYLRTAAWEMEAPDSVFHDAETANEQIELCRLCFMEARQLREILGPSSPTSEEAQQKYREITWQHELDRAFKARLRRVADDDERSEINRQIQHLLGKEYLHAEAWPFKTLLKRLVARLQIETEDGPKIRDQHDLAEKLGLTDQEIMDLLDGQSTPSNTLLQLMSMLNNSVILER